MMAGQSQLAPFLYTPRLRLDLLDYSQAHADCILACLNNPTAYERMGNFGITTLDGLDKMLTGSRLRSTQTRDVQVAQDSDIELMDYDCVYLLRLEARAVSRLIGVVSVRQRGGDVPPDIGWALLEAYHGQGYATEAAKELLRYAREDMKLVEIIALPGPKNSQSVSVARKIGLVEGGRIVKEDSGEVIVVYVLPGMSIEGIPSVVF